MHDPFLLRFFGLWDWAFSWWYYLTLSARHYEVNEFYELKFLRCLNVFYVASLSVALESLPSVG